MAGGGGKSAPCVCANVVYMHVHQGANLCTFERGRRTSTAGAPGARGGTQYCGSI